MKTSDIISSDSVTVAYYAGETLLAGKIVGMEMGQATKAVVNKIQNLKRAVPIGISLQNVTRLKQSRGNFYTYDAIVGSKINILTSGSLVVKMNKKLKIPIHQPLYVDPTTSQLTWRKYGSIVGSAASSQDQDGWLRARVNFNGS